MIAITYPAKISAVSYSLRNQLYEQSKCKELEMAGQVQLKIRFYAVNISQKIASKLTRNLQQSMLKQRRLVKGAIPMILKKSDPPSSASSNSSSSSLKRVVHQGENEPLKKRQAFGKRERSHASAHIAN